MLPPKELGSGIEPVNRITSVNSFRLGIFDNICRILYGPWRKDKWVESSKISKSFWTSFANEALNCKILKESEIMKKSTSNQTQSKAT